MSTSENIPEVPPLPDPAPAAMRAVAPEGSSAQPTVIYRDPNDVRTIRVLVGAVVVVGLFALLTLLGLLYRVYQHPDRIVVAKMTHGERVVMINNKEYGFTEAVKMERDRPGKEDKIYLASEFVRLLYEVDPASRQKDIKRALEIMLPHSARVLSKYLVDSGILNKQRAEAWQSLWQPQDVSMDRADPWTVNVIGKQQITRVVAGRAVTETRQVKLKVRVHKDPAEKRAPQNLNTGYLVEMIDHKDLGVEPGGPTLTATNTQSASDPSAVQPASNTGPFMPAP